MRKAVENVFDKSQHRLCRWHITNPWEFELEQLYIQHKEKNLREKLQSLFNYPLGPTKFEIEWESLVQEFGIKEHPAIKALWEKRSMWISSYFKGLYCGRMTSTQRSESQNRLIKDGYVDRTTPLHLFARKNLEVIQHQQHLDAGEKHYSQVHVQY